MKQWLSRMKLAHKMVLGFLGLIALPFTLLSVFSFASVASHYEHQLAQDGQYMLNMVVSDVNEKMDHVEMLMQVLSCNQNLIAFLSHDYNGAVSHEEYTQTVMPLLQGASNAVSPPLERVYLLTKNTTIPEGYSAVYHYDSVPKRYSHRAVGERKGSHLVSCGDRRKRCVVLPLSHCFLGV